MYIRKKKYPSGNIGIIVVEKINGKTKNYRYLDKLSDSQHRIVKDISVGHTRKILGGHIGVLFYDVPLYTAAH